MSASVHDLYDPPVHLITASHGGQRSGRIVTWAVPATLATSRPRLALVLSRRGLTYELVRQGGRLCVHWLAAHQALLVPRFGVGSGRERDKFAGLEVELTPGGQPLLSGARGWAEGRAVGWLPLEDREVCVVELEHLHLSPERPALTQSQALASLPPQEAEALRRRYVEDTRLDDALLRGPS